MKVIVFATMALAMAGCAGADDTTPGVVAGDENAVTVRATDGVDPGPAATAYCAKFGKQAVRRLVTPIPDQNAPGTALYPFACL